MTVRRIKLLIAAVVALVSVFFANVTFASETFASDISNSAEVSLGLQLVETTQATQELQLVETTEGAGSAPVMTAPVDTAPAVTETVENAPAQTTAAENAQDPAATSVSADSAGAMYHVLSPKPREASCEGSTRQNQIPQHPPSLSSWPPREPHLCPHGEQLLLVPDQ